MKDKISILLPVFNDEKFIKRAVDSVLNNSYSNYELIIVNDGSTDNSLEIINSIKDERIKVFNKSNSGLIETLNYGLKKCKNEIIMRMDGDDEIDKEKITIQLSNFSNSNSILLGTGGSIIDNMSKFKSLVNVPENNISILRKMRKMQPSIIHASIMFYKDAIIKSGSYDEKFSVAEDYELFYRLSRLGELRNIDIPLYKIRKNEENVSVTRSRTQLLNTMIARKLYFDTQTFKVDIEEYSKTKIEIEKSYTFKLINLLNNKINNSSNQFLSTLFKTFRKIISITLS
jgi:glycosyltransferase involved in cell wall biosynthesis